MKTNEDATIGTESIPQSPSFPYTLGEAHAGSPDEGRGNERQPSGDAESGHPSGQNRADASKDGDHLRGRYRSGVPTPNDVGKIEEALLEAFKQGRPDLVYSLSRELVDLALSSVTEASKARFALNFGSEKCSNCEGLKVGPGVVATCFQVSQCYYKNFKQGDLTPKQERLLRVLG